ncbi:MAG TPA: hypothetical protein VHF89_14270 [Solirubrobacteraceae bacterium]|nr:hypothetical protein [Solirubrobacteraceae bacterium]
MDAPRILFERLIDDAGLFPPARKPMEQAVADHRAARASEHAWMLGRFLCPASRLPGLAQETDLEVGAILDGPDWRADLAAVERHPGNVVLVERRLPPAPDAPALVEAAGGREVFLEVPWDDPRTLTTALEDVAAAGAGAKLRCGGVTPEAFPPDEAVARFITECRRLGVRFKATAGLHHPFRTPDAELGVLQHGFVNLLAATAIVEADTVAIVAERDPAAFAFPGESIGWHGNFGDAAEARASFTAFGSCSFSEPVEDLTSHRLLAVA